jgi:hypothetical protein
MVVSAWKRSAWVMMLLINRGRSCMMPNMVSLLMHCLSSD